MTTLNAAYPGLQGFNPQDILTQAMVRARSKGQPAPNVILYSNVRTDKFGGTLLDVGNGVALLAVADSHQVVELANIGAVTIGERLNA